MKRRSEKRSQAAVALAKEGRQKGMAWDELGLFHDNNSREAEAIPCYRKAVRRGLDKQYESMARAWPASSLFKTHCPQPALAECRRVLTLAPKDGVRRFVLRLERRIRREV